jgi:peptidoglycan L-alanyl-D-glutamate endopeptidase CwlK
VPKFSSSSLAQLGTCDPRLQDVMGAVIGLFDFTVLEGHRGEADQERAYAKGLSKVHWPYGKHNSTPSQAVDIAPYPIDWGDGEGDVKAEAARQRFCYLAGFVMAAAAQRGVRLRWGGDWNGDRDTRDERFRDLGHFEISPEG